MGGRVVGTKNIATRVISDAMAVCGSIYRLNAKRACGYAFTVADNKKSVGTGEFRFASEDDPGEAGFDGYIDFETHTLVDLKSGQTRKLT